MNLLTNQSVVVLNYLSHSAYDIASIHQDFPDKIKNKRDKFTRLISRDIFISRRWERWAESVGPSDAELFVCVCNSPESCGDLVDRDAPVPRNSTLSMKQMDGFAGRIYVGNARTFRGAREDLLRFITCYLVTFIYIYIWLERPQKYQKENKTRAMKRWTRL